MHSITYTTSSSRARNVGAWIAVLASGLLAGASSACDPHATPAASAHGAVPQTPADEPAPKPADTRPADTKAVDAAAPKPLPIDGYEIVATHPHDAHSFTQGLVFHDGRFLESQGGYRTSSLRRVEITTGKVLQMERVAPEYFAEGIAILKGIVYQLTWKERTGLIYTLGDLKLQGRFQYSFEGWGLTTDGTSLILSDGTSTLRWLDPTGKFAVVKSVNVRAAGKAIDQLNELEWVHGEIWANVWHTDRIARIDPATGDVTRWIDLAGLLPIAEHPDSESVLNGIAWDAKTDRIWVTGKMWPKLFEIRLKKKS